MTIADYFDAIGSRDQQKFSLLKPKYLNKQQEQTGYSGLMVCAASINNDFAAHLIEFEAGLQCKSGWTALMFAARSHNVDLVRQLIGRESGIQDRRGFTALMCAAIRGHENIVQLFINRKTEINLKTSHSTNDCPKGANALILAALKGKVKIVELLIKFEIGGTSPNLIDYVLKETQDTQMCKKLYVALKEWKEANSKVSVGKASFSISNDFSEGLTQLSEQSEVKIFKYEDQMLRLKEQKAMQEEKSAANFMKSLKSPQFCAQRELIPNNKRSPPISEQIAAKDQQISEQIDQNSAGISEQQNQGGQPIQILRNSIQQQSNIKKSQMVSIIVDDHEEEQKGNFCAENFIDAAPIVQNEQIIGNASANDQLAQSMAAYWAEAEGEVQNALAIDRFQEEIMIRSESSKSRRQLEDKKIINSEKRGNSEFPPLSEANKLLLSRQTNADVSQVEDIISEVTQPEEVVLVSQKQYRNAAIQVVTEDERCKRMLWVLLAVVLIYVPLIDYVLCRYFRMM